MLKTIVDGIHEFLDVDLARQESCLLDFIRVKVIFFIKGYLKIFFIIIMFIILNLFV